MKQTVTGRFKTWNDALHAQDVLMMKGFEASDIEVPAHSEGVLAGIERLIGGFFAHDPRAGGAHDVDPTQQQAPEETVLVGVHVVDEVHALLARDTLREEQAQDISTHGLGWAWPDPGTPGAREHSALEELGLAQLADTVRRRVTAARSHTPQADTEASADLHHSGTEAEATAPTSASAPGAGAVMGQHVDVPGAPEATRPAQGAAPQIPDEFLEYEDDTPSHHQTLH